MKSLYDKINKHLNGSGRSVTIDTLYKARAKSNAGEKFSGLSSKLATDLEAVTGISRNLWLFPAEFGNAFEVYLLQK